VHRKALEEAVVSRKRPRFPIPVGPQERSQSSPPSPLSHPHPRGPAGNALITIARDRRPGLVSDAESSSREGLRTRPDPPATGLHKHYLRGRRNTPRCFQSPAARPYDVEGAVLAAVVSHRLLQVVPGRASPYGASYILPIPCETDRCETAR